MRGRPAVTIETTISITAALVPLLVLGIAPTAAIAGVAPASSPAPDVVFEWTAPAGCPTAATLRADVERLLRHPLAASTTALEVRIRVAHAPKGPYHMELKTITAAGAGERTLDAPTCSAAADAAALIVALAVDPSSVAAAAPSSRAAPVEVEPPVFAVARPAAAGSEPAPPSTKGRAGVRPTIGVAVRVGAMGDGGALPRPTAGPAIAAGVRLWRARGVGAFAVHAEITGGYLWPAKGTVAGMAEVGGRIGLWAAGAQVCPAFERGRWSARLCARFEAGVMHGRGFGVAVVASGSAPWLALGGGAVVALKLVDRLGVYAEAGAALPVGGRPTFTLENVGDVHQPGRVSGRAGLGLFVNFAR